MKKGKNDRLRRVYESFWHAHKWELRIGLSIWIGVLFMTVVLLASWLIHTDQLFLEVGSIWDLHVAMVKFHTVNQDW